MTSPHDPQADPIAELNDLVAGGSGATSSGGGAGSAPAGSSPDDRPRRRRGRLARRIGPTWANVVEWGLVFGGAILLAIVVKVFLLQAFYIPSASMYPTLQKDDRVLVNKLSYKVHDVNRGDVVVFERPASETATDIPDLIKRVVGLPGESLVIEAGHVYVDGRMLDESYLPDGVTTSTDNSPYKCTRADPCVVPEGDVWVMGDNRNDSKDSRWFGPIEDHTIVGRAFFVVWPLSRWGIL